jgi:tetratricopeptide (TPR) repeat protein
MVRLRQTLLLFVTLLLTLGAAQPPYTLDKDPIRVGKKALEEGRLADATRAFEEALTASYQVPKAAYGLAEIAVRQGRLHDAEGLYRRAVEAGRYPEARAGLALLLIRLGRETEAEQEIKTALDQDSDLWAAQYGKARLLLAQSRAEDAKTFLDRGSRRKGMQEGEDQYHQGMALYWIDRGDLKQAETEALNALALNAADPEIALLVGRIYQMRKTPFLAIDAFEAALATPGSAPTAPLLDELGRLYEQVGRYPEARDRYLRAVDVDSMYAPALRDLADLWLRGKQQDMAARTYLRYLQIEPNDIEALLDLSASCLETQRFEDARGAAEKAMALDSTRADAKLAYVRSGLRSPDRAVNERAAAIAEALPDSLWTAPDRALLIANDIEAGRYDRATERLEKAMAADPENAALHFQQGMLRLKMNDPKDAIPALERAAALEPTEPLYPVNLGVAQLQLQKPREALAPLRQALAIDPTLTSARLLLAQALTSCDSLTAAEAEYRKVLETDPGNAKAFRGIGYSAIQRGAYKDAVASYRKATEIEPQDADAWGGLGSAYLGLQHWSAAETAFHRAQAIDPQNRTAQRGLELLKRAKGN